VNGGCPFGRKRVFLKMSFSFPLEGSLWWYFACMKMVSSGSIGVHLGGGIGWRYLLIVLMKSGCRYVIV